LDDGARDRSIDRPRASRLLSCVPRVADRSSVMPMRITLFKEDFE
jgi:hypothetical protein